MDESEELKGAILLTFLHCRSRRMKEKKKEKSIAKELFTTHIRSPSRSGEKGGKKGIRARHRAGKDDPLYFGLPYPLLVGALRDHELKGKERRRSTRREGTGEEK